MAECSFVATAVIAICAFSACFYGVTSFLLRRWSRAPLRNLSTSPEPVTFFRPIKNGESVLEENLRAFLKSIEPDDQVLIGVGCLSDLRLCETIAHEFPDSDILCCHCETGTNENPKVAKLIQIEAFAKHERWIILDSDTVMKRQILQAFRAEWAALQSAAISAPYFFTGFEGNVSRLDALGTGLSLWPGVALLRVLQRVHFLMGPCMGVQASVLQTLGGWKTFKYCLAEDHELGAAIHKWGGHLHLSTVCVPVVAGKMGVAEWMLHQHRVFATYRICNPWGSLGVPLTHGVAFSLIFALVTPCLIFGWFLFFLLLVLRTVCAGSLPGNFRFKPVSVFVVSICEPLFWLASWLPLPVRWGGRSIRPRRARAIASKF